jgi:hypothetical protein
VKVAWGGCLIFLFAKNGASSDAIPDAAGGEGVHGAANLDRVIHRVRFLPEIMVEDRGSSPVYAKFKFHLQGQRG